MWQHIPGYCANKHDRKLKGEGNVRELHGSKSYEQRLMLGCGSRNTMAALSLFKGWREATGHRRKLFEALGK